jgi:hypothetical protein
MERLDPEVQRVARVRGWGVVDAARVVGAWRRSGVSRAEFRRRYGVAAHRLYYWISAGERRRVVVPPYAYLSDVMHRIVAKVPVENLLPDRWQLLFADEAGE